MAGTILLIDKDPDMLGSLGRFLEREGREVLQALTAHAALEICELHCPDVAILDLQLPDPPGTSLVTKLQNRGAAVVALAEPDDVAAAVDAVKAGAESFLIKPIDLEHFGVVLDRAFEKARREVVRKYERERLGETSLLEALGRSTHMREMAVQIERLALADRTTVLLTGERGTGKGWVATLIHRLSSRSEAAFLELSCSAHSGRVLESELFGHEKGAVPYARRLKRGVFEIADGGTLFLDEIGDLDLALQAKLRKVLEEHTFRRIGGARDIEVDVRLIVATSRDLQEAVAEGAFKEELFYELNVMPIRLPPLRECGDADIAKMARRIFGGLRREMPRGPEQISQEALQLLVRYDWPGNVRELRNVLERARMVAGDDVMLRPTHLPAEIRAPLGVEADGGALPTLQSVEQRHIKNVLLQCGGNRTRAARALGVSRATLHNKIRRYGFENVGLEVAREKEVQ